MLVLSAELGSFSACGRKMGKGQSAVSQGIANLELDLNVVLFNRQGRTPRLTADGERVLLHAKALLRQASEIEKVAGAIEGKQEALIRLMFDDSVCTPALFQILAKFEQKFPYIKLDIMTQASPDIAAYIESDRVDIGIVFSDFSLKHNVDLCLIGNMNFVAVCHPEHPLSQLTSVNIHHLLSHRQLLLKGLNENTLTQISPMSAEIWWSGSFELMREMVLQNCGWAYLPQHMALPLINHDQLHALPVLLDHKPWNLTVDLLWQKGQIHGPGKAWLTESLKSMLDP